MARDPTTPETSASRPRSRTRDETPREGNLKFTAVRPVRRAYEQVADQLRERIVAGELAVGERLPREAELASMFEVSRPTVREALRVLAAHNLIRTTKGAAGGSFVTIPTLDHIVDLLTANLALDPDRLDLGELLEVRELLEISAVRLAARRRTATQIERMDEAIEQQRLIFAGELEPRPDHHDFHRELIGASNNRVLSTAGSLLHSILHTYVQRSSEGGEQLMETISDDHSAIAAAVRDGDEEAAAQAMREHLDYLRPLYEEAWKELEANAAARL